MDSLSQTTATEGRQAPIDPGGADGDTEAGAFALTPVPAAQRKSWVSITLVMTAMGMDLSGLLLGLALAKGLTLWWAIAAVLLGSALLGLLAILCALVGARTGLSSAMIAAFAFGRQGARLVALSTVLSLLGWFAVQVGFLGNNLSSALSLFGIHLPPAGFSVVGGVLMTWTALYGYRAMDRLARWTVPMMVLLVGAALVMLLLKLDGAHARPVEAPMSFLAAVSFVVGTFIAGVSLFPDISRYASSARDAVLGAFLGIMVGNSVTLVVAVVLAKFTGDADLIKVFASLHLGVFSIIVLVLAQWSINSANLYSAGLASMIVGRGLRISNGQYVLGIGVVGVALALLGIADNFLAFLLVLSLLIAPIGGAYSGRYFVVLRGRFPQRPANVVGSTLLAWAAGSVVAWMSTPNDPGAGLWGLGLLSLTTVPAVDGFLTGFLVASLPALARLFQRDTN